MSEYNKELCEERQRNRNSQLSSVANDLFEHDSRIRLIENAVLTLTKIAEKEKVNRILMIALCTVIVALAFGKEIAVVLISKVAF